MAMPISREWSWPVYDPDVALIAIAVVKRDRNLVASRPMNGYVFRAYVQQQLLATLQAGDLVIMDNPAGDKVAGVREAIVACC